MIKFDGKVVLASASPRRQELIKLIFENVEILPAECDETLPEAMGAREAVEYLSKIKKDIKTPILNKYDTKKYKTLEIEKRVTYIYSLIYEDINKQEIQNKPIVTN